MEKEARAGGLKLRGWILNAILALMMCAVIGRSLVIERDKMGFMVACAESGGTVEAV